jgi:hypothetical protein
MVVNDYEIRTDVVAGAEYIVRYLSYCATYKLRYLGPDSVALSLKSAAGFRNALVNLYVANPSASWQSSALQRA